jgi:hypothetical protein
MRLVRAFGGGTRAVPAQHLARLPPHDAHEVTVVAAFKLLVVRERVPKHVRVDMIDTSLTTSPDDHRADSMRGDVLPSHSADMAACGWRVRARK